MNCYRPALALGLLVLLPLAGCRSDDQYHQMKSAETTEWRACCGTECTSDCTKSCCQDYFKNKSTAGVYKSCCGKACGATCTAACCNK